MRSGVLIVELTPSVGNIVRLASRMYADANTLFRGHLQGFTQTRKMTDALAGRTSMSVANMAVHNQNEEYDSALFSGTADIRIGDDTDAVASMAPVMLDANVELVSRTDNEIIVAVLDGQSRGNTKQQRIFDTSGDGFGALLPEIWGKSYRFPLITLDGDAGKVFGCAGPLSSISAVYVDEVKQNPSEYSLSILGTTATVTFVIKRNASVFIDAIGLGSVLPGALLNDLLTRVSSICQGHPLSSTSTTVTLDDRIDDATATLVGKTLKLYRESGVTDTRTISAFDTATNIATISGGAWSTNPASDDIYSITVNTAAGGFTDSQVASAGFDAIDASLPYSFGLIGSNGINAIRLQDQLLGPLLCHMGPRRNGVVTLTRLSPAVAPAVTNITRIIGEIQRRPMPIYWHVEARYRADSPGGHWRSVSAFDASIKAAYPNAKTLTIDVPVQERNGAKEIAEQWLVCFGFPTELATMQVDHDLSGLDLGDVVEVFDDRYQFNGGKLATVVSMTDVFDGYDELGIWVGME